MRVNQVVLVPSVYKTGDEGQIFGHFSEREAIYGYMESCLERIEEDRIPVRIHSELEPIQVNTLLIHCRIGVDPAHSKAKCNSAAISYIGEGSAPLARLLSESLIDWGKSYVDYHHKTANPRPATDPHYDGTIGIIVRPFRINGPNADLYMQSLDQLGWTIAHSVYEFMISRGELPGVMRLEG